MRVRYSRRALTEIAAILAYVGKQDERSAQRINAYLQRLTTRISEFPEASERVAQRPNVRRIPFIRYPYSLYYTVDRKKGEVILLRIVHGAQRTPFDHVE